MEGCFKAESLFDVSDLIRENVQVAERLIAGLHSVDLDDVISIGQKASLARKARAQVGLLKELSNIVLCERVLASTDAEYDDRMRAAAVDLVSNLDDVEGAGRAAIANAGELRPSRRA